MILPPTRVDNERLHPSSCFHPLVPTRAYERAVHNRDRLALSRRPQTSSAGAGTSLGASAHICPRVATPLTRSLRRDSRPRSTWTAPSPAAPCGRHKMSSPRPARRRNLRVALIEATYIRGNNLICRIASTQWPRAGASAGAGVAGISGIKRREAADMLGPGDTSQQQPATTRQERGDDGGGGGRRLSCLPERKCDKRAWV